MSQIVFAEPVYAGITATGHQLAAANQRVRATKLQAASDAANLFFQLLIAQINADVQASNVRATQANLDAATTRNDVGTGEPGDVYRWQSQLAMDRNKVVSARANIIAAWAQLAQVIRLPMAKPMAAALGGLRTSRNARVEQYVNTPAKFATFADFCVQEALSLSPELQQIDATVRAQSRMLTSRKRALYLPQVQLQGEVSYLAYRKFTDQQPITIPGVGELDFSFNAPRFNWFLGLGLSVPIFTGFRQSRELDEAQADLDALNHQRDGIKLKVEASVRSALSIVGARSAAIDFAQAAAVAAEKNYQVTRDAYQAGQTSTVRLLDAQTQAVAARFNAQTAFYQFYQALVDVQRAIGRFDVFDTTLRKAWFERLDHYFRSKRKREPSE